MVRMRTEPIPPWLKIIPASRSAGAMLRRHHQIDMRYSERVGQLIERDDRRIAASAFKTAQILLAEPGRALHLLLSETFFAPNARKVLADKLAHIHAGNSAVEGELALSTILCIRLTQKTILFQGDARCLGLLSRRLSYLERSTAGIANVARNLS